MRKLRHPSPCHLETRKTPAVFQDAFSCEPLHVRATRRLTVGKTTRLVCHLAREFCLRAPDADTRRRVIMLPKARRRP
jgi:hypothetical protein